MWSSDRHTLSDLVVRRRPLGLQAEGSFLFGSVVAPFCLHSGSVEHMNDEASAETMPEDFTPSRPGRPVVVNAVPVIKQALKAEGKWLVFSTYSHNEIRSIVRQIKASGEPIQTSVSSTNGRARLFVRSTKEES